MSGQLILVTGITGFIAGQIANAFLEAGYRVRGTTRGEKAKLLSDTINVPGLEFVRVDDVASDDLSEAMKDVYAVIHVASPLPARASVAETLSTAISGTLHLLTETTKAGIKKTVITSSFGALLDPDLRSGFAGLTFDHKSWGVASRETAEAKSEDDYYVYFSSKILAEKAVWDYAKEHPELDIATVLPGFVFGPFADHYPLPSLSLLATASNGYMYMLAQGGLPPLVPPFTVDVRDVAKTHVLALSVGPKPLGEKRYISNSGNITWGEAAVALKKAHPELKLADSFPDLPGPASTLDNKYTTEQLNFGTWITPEETIIAAVEAVMPQKGGRGRIRLNAQ
ncbi:hypothetical protein H0H93_006930 [Arthromyces matolae]|nr:hypothetical protein H0H93_006930 [Arthromyces matolae]